MRAKAGSESADFALLKLPCEFCRQVIQLMDIIMRRSSMPRFYWRFPQGRPEESFANKESTVMDYQKSLKYTDSKKIYAQCSGPGGLRLAEFMAEKWG